MRTTTRTAVLAAAAVSLASAVVAAAPSASATPPLSFGTEPQTYVFDSVCDFPIQYDETVNSGKIRIWLESGRLIGSGPYRARITNLQDPSRSVDVNATGAVFLNMLTGYERGVGHTLIVGRAGIEAPDLVGLHLATGTWTFTRDAGGGITAITGDGQVGDDLCDVIG